MAESICVGGAVTCEVCGLRKKPLGRSAPMAAANSLCDHECDGYYEDPKPPWLWPGETCRDFYGRADLYHCGHSPAAIGIDPDADDEPGTAAETAEEA